MLTYVHNIDLIQNIREFDVILIGTNTINKLGNGFQRKIALNFPYVNDVNVATPYGDIRKLGSVKVIPSQDDNPIFCLCYINTGRRRPDLNPIYVDYNALEKCMSLINEHFKGKRIATTLIGASLFDGAGEDNKIKNILASNSDNIDLYVYDYEQIDYHQEEKKKYKELLTHLHTDYFDDFKKRYYWTVHFGELSNFPKECESMSYREFSKYIKEKKQSR